MAEELTKEEIKLKNVASAVGKGLFAGAVGTALMTVSSTLELKLRGREASTAPADAAGKLLGVQPRDPEGQARFSSVVHWGYGTGWGAVRGLIGAVGINGSAATGTHFAMVYGSEVVMLPALEVAPPAWTWEPKEIAIDVFHHLVYAVGTSIAYRTLDN